MSNGQQNFPTTMLCSSRISVFNTSFQIVLCHHHKFFFFIFMLVTSCEASDVNHFHKDTSKTAYYHNEQVTYSCDSGYEHADSIRSFPFSSPNFEKVGSSLVFACLFVPHSQCPSVISKEFLSLSFNILYMDSS